MWKCRNQTTLDGEDFSDSENFVSLIGSQPASSRGLASLKVFLWKYQRWRSTRCKKDCGRYLFQLSQWLTYIYFFFLTKVKDNGLANAPQMVYQQTSLELDTFLQNYKGFFYDKYRLHNVDYFISYRDRRIV